MPNLIETMLRLPGITTDDFAKKMLEQRMVFLDGKITPELADNIVKMFLAFDLKSNAPITLLIDSKGGDVKSANKISGFIQALNSPVDGLVIGECSSMAIDILLSCRTRRALQCAIFFMHFTRHGFEVVLDSEHVSEEILHGFERRMTDDKKAREEFYAKQLKKTPEEIHKLFHLGEKYDLHYTAAQALGIGLVTEIDTNFKFFVLPAAQ
jgi:ATP-dependent protease ClpP protease subunit